MRNNIYFQIIFIVHILITGCSGENGNDGLTGPKGQDGPKLTGSLSGYAILEDEFGFNLNSSSMVSVSINSIAKSVNTDSTGKWKIDSLETGTYDITFTKPGFGTYIKYSYQFVGGSNSFYGTVKLGQLPSFEISSFLVNSNGAYINTSGTINKKAPSYTSLFLAVFAGTDSTVSSNPEHYKKSYIGLIFAGSNLFNYDTDLKIFKGNDFTSGQKIYLCAYSINILSSALREGSSYVDPRSGKIIFPGLGAKKSKVVSFVLP